MPVVRDRRRAARRRRRPRAPDRSSTCPTDRSRRARMERRRTSPTWAGRDEREVATHLAVAVHRAPRAGGRADDRARPRRLHPVWGMRRSSSSTLFLMFQAVFTWAQLPMDLDQGGRRRGWAVLTAWLPDGMLQQPAGRRRDRGSGERAGLPAADPDPVPVHPRARGLRLPAARRVPARPPDGQRGPVRAFVHSAAVELRVRDPRHHGDAHASATGATG